MPRREAHWKIAPAAPDAFLNATPEHPILAQALYNRGLRTPAEVNAFLNGGQAAVENPYKLRDMPKAVQRILKALEKQETICVYGDFDVDGVASTALLVTALQALGGRVGPYIPDRVDEGYGLNREAVMRIAGQAQLLITVDCGVRSLAEVACAVERGLDVIVSDHHSVGKELPPALAVINPRRPDCPASFKRLAGAGVAFRLAQAVLRAAAHERWSPLSPDQIPEVEASLLDLVALGTVADMMPLLDENRSLVRRGLESINAAPRPGLEALMLQAGLRKGLVDATAISFRLAPRLNAAGRLGDARLAYRLLRTRDPNEAHQLADALNALNERRRALTEAAQAEAEQQLAERLAQDPPILIVGGEAFEHGVVGLVAGRLTERYYRPAVVMRRDAEEVRGSARSIPEFDVSQALDEVAHLLVRHGGHPLAAGFTVKRMHEPALREALEALAAERLSDRSLLRPTLWIDAVAPLSQITWGLAEQLARLEPTGQENPPPTLMAPSVRVRSARTVGGDKHLRLVLDDGSNGVVYDAVAFHQGEWAQHLGEGSRVDVAFQLEVNEWQGVRRLQLNVQDLRAPAPIPIFL
jgi:single-stranded-DNA-specific exonuclease